MFDRYLDGKRDRVGAAAPGCPAEQSSAVPPPNIQRRAFIASSFTALAGLALWQWRRPRTLQAAAPTEAKAVTVVLFSDLGQRLKVVEIAKVMKTPDEWRKQLSANTYDITRNADTEMAFSGKYWNLEEKGLFRCICCDNALVRFGSEIRFRHGMAQLLATDRQRERHRDTGHDIRHGSH